MSDNLIVRDTNNNGIVTPGVVVKALNTTKEVLFSTVGLVKKGVTIASGQGVIDAGTVIGIITASEKGGKYVNTNADGTEVAVGVTLGVCDATSADAFVEVAYAGVVNIDALVGLDAGAISDLGMRQLKPYRAYKF